MAGYGGYRPGAGRPPYAKSKLDEKARAAAMESGITPLEFFLAIMRDEPIDDLEPPFNIELRMDAAKAAAPYMHAKLQAIDCKHTGQNNGPIRLETVLVTGALASDAT